MTIWVSLQGFRYRVVYLSMSHVIVPLALVGVTIDVEISSVSVAHIILPVSLVSGPVWVDKHSVTLLLVLNVLSCNKDVKMVTMLRWPFLIIFVEKSDTSAKLS